MPNDTTTRERTGPLDGLRVVDCSGMISGGFATAQLADHGADVVMVEHPDVGDPIREWPPFEDGSSLWWKSLGRNKRCVTLDLSSAEGSALLLELVEEADVFFENFRPGTLEKWGLGPETLRDANDELVVVRLSGYGQTGPRSQKPGFGTVAEGMSTWAHVNGYPDRKPLLPPISLADLSAANFAVQATMFALFERDVGRGGSGEGQVIDVSLYESLFRLFVGDVEAYDKQGEVRERIGNHHSNASPRNVYETTDGHIVLSASAQSIFENLAENVLGKPELLEDERFADNDARVEHADELDEILEAWTRQHSTEEALRLIDEGDAVAGPVYDISDVFEDEQYQARDDIVRVADDDVGEVATINTTPKFSRTDGAIEHLGPGHGEHNDEVFREELGLDAGEYERLRAEGII